MEMPRFHLAFPVAELVNTRKFYVEVLGCRVGRESDRWIDFDFYGHQISAHLDEGMSGSVASNPVDGKQIPIPHFGVILKWDDWHNLADMLKGKGIDFMVEPYIRFKGEVGEQATLFIKDPSGNHLEFKSFKSMSRLFAH